MRFWTAQANACTALSCLGYNYRMNERIPVFAMFLAIRRMEGNMANEAREALCQLAELKREGREPPHAYDRYITT